jgi:carotenoid cleavage dioxygenase-like enzyme
MPTEIIRRVASDITPGDHPYLQGAWTPLHEEVNATEMRVLEGRIPSDIDGVYLRNTQNPVYRAIGRYHPFDGDGMIHMIHFKDGQASYRNRFVDTKGLRAEQEAGHRLWAGLMEDPKLSERPGWGAHGSIKDASSTDVVVHAGKALTSYYQCGEGYRMDPLTLEQQGIPPWSPLDGISAHMKVDEATGELLFFNYSKHAPYMHYGVVDRHDKLVHYVPIPLPGPRLPHDMAFTEHYAILNDFPAVLGPGAAQAGQTRGQVPSRTSPRDSPSSRAAGRRTRSAGSRPRRPSCCTGSTPMRKATRSSWTATSRTSRNRRTSTARPRATSA